jgi:hypothetical protein
MAKQTVNLGTMADNKSGDPLRTAFEKINENFDELYASTHNTSSLVKQGAGLEELGVLQDTYQELVIQFEEQLMSMEGEEGYPFGVQLPITNPTATYETLMNLGPNTTPGFVSLVVIANTMVQAYTAFQEAVVSAEITSGDLTLRFNNLGELVFPDGTKQTTAFVEETPSMISSGNTAPGSAVVANETSVDVNFSGSGTKFKFKSNGDLQVSSGDIVNQSNVSLFANKVTEPAPSTFGTIATVISSPTQNVNWTAGTGIAGGISNSNIGISITNGVPTFTINDAGVPGRYVGEQIFNITGSTFGGTDGIDDMVIIVDTVSDNVTELDVTKDVHYLEEGDYNLPDGVEGKVIQFVPKTTRNVWLRVANLAYMAYNEQSQSFNLRTVGTDYWFNPFYVQDQGSGSLQSQVVTTAVFIGGAWNFSNGVID